MKVRFRPSSKAEGGWVGRGQERPEKSEGARAREGGQGGQGAKGPRDRVGSRPEKLIRRTCSGTGPIVGGQATWVGLRHRGRRASAPPPNVGGRPRPSLGFRV